MRASAAFHTIKQALATGSIGTPVAVRLIANLADHSDEVIELSNTLVEQLLAWLGEIASSTDQMGDASQQISHLVRTTNGRSGARIGWRLPRRALGRNCCVRKSRCPIVGGRSRISFVPN